MLHSVSQVWFIATSVVPPSFIADSGSASWQVSAGHSEGQDFYKHWSQFSPLINLSGERAEYGTPCVKTGGQTTLKATFVYCIFSEDKEDGIKMKK